MRIPLSGLPFWTSLLRRIPPPPDGKAYAVGGWVRDMVMLRRPSRQEIDLAVEGDAVRWGNAIAQSFAARLGPVSEFKTCKIEVLHDGVPVRIDIASCRKDSYPVPGGMPVVTPASVFEDLYRRDFSVNAMAFPLDYPLQKSLVLLDPVGGREDVERKGLRILSPASFEDDPVRIFRLFRFQERLGFHPDLQTTRALESARLHGSILKASKSRLWDELQNAVREESRMSIIFRWLLETPWEGALPSLRMSSPRRARVFAWNHLIVHESVFSPMGRFWKETLLLLALLYGLPRKECDQALRLFGVPEKKAKIVRDTLFPFHPGDGRTKKGWSDSPADLPPHKVFLKIVREGSGLRALFERDLVAQQSCSPGTTFLTGEDLIKEGVKPSPEMGHLIAEIRKLWREGVLSSRREQLEWVRARTRPTGKKLKE